MSPLPATARAVERSVTGIVAAAATRQVTLFDQESDRLAALDPERVRLVMGGVLSSLLEARMPDGLSGEDLRDLVERGVRQSAAWFPAVDTDAFVVVLTDALGVVRDEEQIISLDHRTVVQHGALLIGNLLATPGELPGHLRHALTEIERDQTVELP